MYSGFPVCTAAGLRAAGLSLTDCELVGEREEVVNAVPDVVVLQVVHQVGAVALHLVTAHTEVRRASPGTGTVHGW